jgi:3-oxoadipate enol-lactonase
LAPDLAGHGVSDRPAGALTIGGLADDVAELLEALEVGPTVVVGLSMGGITALALAERHPALVSSVVVINSLARVPEGMTAALQSRAERVRVEGMANLAEETVARWFTSNFAEREPALVAAVRDELGNDDADVHAEAWLAMADADFESDLASLPHSLLVITGSLDQSVPETTGARLAALAPHGHHVHLHGAGHMSPLEEPDRLAGEILAFLDQR